MRRSSRIVEKGNQSFKEHQINRSEEVSFNSQYYHGRRSNSDSSMGSHDSNQQTLVNYCLSVYASVCLFLCPSVFLISIYLCLLYGYYYRLMMCGLTPKPYSKRLSNWKNQKCLIWLQQLDT
jgi:hypothetical protein